ncbi:nuclear transport factor 2 family protein [Cryptosporangium japonicum]|uniref:SnoaL-like domain-containing protein n=1 Tax=Cryptosporangium japonicum TaxID=80872 RepID=A0ABP3DD90_9ACTN
MSINRHLARIAMAAALGASVLLAFAGVAQAKASDRTTPRHPQCSALLTTWFGAWNSNDGKRLGTLFTADGHYTDHAFGAAFTGPDGVAGWVTLSHAHIAGLHGKLRWEERHGDEVVFGWTFSGQITGAPHAFSVPAVTVVRLRGAKIAANDDYYSRADVLKQSGLPADWQPPA